MASDPQDPWMGLGTPLSKTKSEVASPDPWMGLGEPVKDFGSTSEQLSRGVALGLKRGLAPHTVTPEEYNRDQSKLEAAATIITDIGVGIGIPVAAGLVAGAVTGGGAAAPAALAASTAASLIYGTYAGIGGEVSRSKAEGKEFSPARAAVAVALEANPSIKLAKRSYAAWRVAAQVAGSSGLEYAHSGEAGSAAIAGGLALIAAPAIYANSGARATRQAGQSFQDAVAGPRGRDLARVTAAKVAALGPQGLELPKRPTMEFMQHVVQADPATPKAAVAASYRELLRKTSPDRMQATFANWRTGKAMAEAAEESVVATAGRLGQAREDISQARKWTAPVEFVARKIDDLLDTDFEGAVANVAKARDKANLVIKGFYDKASDLDTAARKLKVTATDIGQALDPEAPGHAAALARVRGAGGDDLLTKYRGLYDEVFGELRQHGFDPGYLSGYVPMRSKLGADAAVAVNAQIRELQARAKVVGKVWHELPEAEGLRGYAKRVLGKDDVSPTDMATLAESVMTQHKQRPGFDPSALRSRTGVTPDFVREYDVNKLLTRYLNGNLKAAILDPSIRQVQVYAPALRAAGLKNAAAWTDEYVKHVSGGVGKGGQLWSAAMESTRRAGLEMLEASPGSLTGKALTAMPEFLVRVNNAVYPATLGLNARANLRNLAQNWATTAPELGGAYGYGVVARATKRLITEERGNLGRMRDKLKSLGQLGDVTGEIQGKTASVAGRAGRAVDALNDASMWTYQSTDVVNRMIAYKAGQAWAEDLAAGNPAALKALRDASTGLKVRINQAGGQAALKNKDALGDILGDYLIGKTQFRYGRETMHAWGREAGSAFSMFTKWPAMAGWDMAEKIQKRQLRAIAARTLPLVVLWGAKHEFDAQDQRAPNDHALRRYLVGDPTEWSPLPGTLSFAEAYTGGPLVKAAAATPGALAKIWRAEDRGEEAASTGRDALRGTVKRYLPPLSQVINEIDRMGQAGLIGPGGVGRATPSRDAINELTGGPK